jgi:hypothetical protein
LAAAQAKNPYLGITELATNGRFRLETREPIGILQATWFLHPEIMAGFRGREKEKITRKYRMIPCPERRFLPTHVGEEPKFI